MQKWSSCTDTVHRECFASDFVEKLSYRKSIVFPLEQALYNCKRNVEFLVANHNTENVIVLMTLTVKAFEFIKVQMLSTSYSSKLKLRLNDKLTKIFVCCIWILLTKKYEL